MSAKPKHRDPIIAAAIRLFRRQGYAATGLNDIVEASGAPKGSLYHYFPEGKVSIAVAAVEEAGRRVAKSMSEIADSSATTGHLLRGHAKQLAGWMKKSGYRDGCPITTVLLELTPQEREVSKAGRTAYAARLGILTEKLVDDGFPRARAERIALLGISALQGALIEARVDRSSAPILTAGDELARLVEAQRQRD